MISNLKGDLQNIGVVASPSLTTGIIPLSHLIKILRAFSSSISVITGKGAIEFFKKDNEGIHFVMVKAREGNSKSIFSRIKNNLSVQLRILSSIVKLWRNTDLWIFFFADGFVLPMLTVKLLGKKVVLGFTGSGLNLKADKLTKDPLIKVSALLQNINYKMADKIILYSENIISEHNMQKYRGKIAIGHEHFLDFRAFRIKKPLSERSDLIGYIGRLQEIKGVLSFVEAIPKILETKNNIQFLIGGDGVLRNEIEKYLEESNLNNHVKLVGWIPHDDLPSYLNELKLVVLPSYTEGLSNLLLEAMACGTPVLATPVGAIPDVIRDEETGFIIKNNSPECIAENVERVFNYPNLDKIAENARGLVEKEYTYKAAVERYKEILEDVHEKIN